MSRTAVARCKQPKQTMAILLLNPLTQLFVLAVISAVIATKAPRKAPHVWLTMSTLMVAFTTIIATAYFQLFAFVQIVICFVPIPLLLIGFVANQQNRKTLTIFSLSLATLLFAAAAPSILYNQWEIGASKIHCAELIPFIEEYKAQHGTYPETLTGIHTNSLIKPLRITLLGETEACGYHKSTALNDNRYALSPLLWYFDSHTQQWEYGD